MAFLQRNTTILSGTSLQNPLTANKPSGTVEGDMMVIWFCGGSNSRRNITPPSGWSVIYNQSSPDLGGSGQQFGYYKVATASEPSSYSFAFSGTNPINAAKLILTSYYDTNGTGTWTVSNLGGGKLQSTAGSITSLSITGAGLYITAFFSDDDDNPTTDNSPVPEIARSVANGGTFITYGGDYTATNHTITQNFDNRDDLYANNVIFAHQVSGDYVSKIRVGSAYKNILDGWVAVDEGLFPGSATSWKKITGGHIKIGDGQKGDWKEIFKPQ